MIAHGVQCPSCKDIVYSRAGHDFRYCTCNGVFVDGGQEEYGTRRGFTKEAPLPVEIELEGVDKKALYDDWNRRKDNFGLIKAHTTDLSQRIVSIGGVRFDTVGRTEGDDNGEKDKARVQGRKKRRPARKSSEQLDNS